MYIRIIKDRKTKFITAGLKLKESDWDEAKQRVKKSYPNSARMNAALAQKIADAEGQIADMERKVKTVSIKKLKEAIKGKEVPNFFEYSRKHCERIKNNVSISTYKNYHAYLDKFEKWVGTKEVYFDDITVSLLMDYMSYLSNELKNGNTTQRYSIMILAIMFKEAIKEDLIPEYMYPFSKLKLKKDPSRRQFLKKEQFEAIINYKLDEKSKASVYRDMFICSIFAGGLRFSDVLEFQVKHFNEEERRIQKVIRKTGRMHQFKIGQLALDIINKYKKEDAEQDDFIFPVITNKELYLKNDEYRYTFIESANKAANFQLQRIAKKLEIPVKVTFHISRHTFATNALNNGMRIEHVSKLMDHRDISTTQVYAKIISEELDKAVDNYIY
ncbi:integrase family protein [Flavobacterium cauense R2A-7]|nr:integrase family protein [Flavobacterium cauense R2A-7]